MSPWSKCKIRFWGVLCFTEIKPEKITLILSGECPGPFNPLCGNTCETRSVVQAAMAQLLESSMYQVLTSSWVRQDVSDAVSYMTQEKNVFYVSNPLLSIKHWCHPRSCMEIQAIDPLELFQLNWINSWVTPEREGHVQQAPHEPCPSNPARLCQNFIHREFHLFVIPLAFAWSHSKQQHSK